MKKENPTTILQEDVICFYEQLRGWFAGAKPANISFQSKGMALLLHRGMAMWMKTITALIPAKSKIREREIGSIHLLEDRQMELINLIANMLLKNNYQEEERV